jgi:putative tricarboxylic transport membrane protein
MLNGDRLGERLVALGVGALGVVVLLESTTIAGSAGFSGVGPRAFPYVIGAALLALAALLARESFAGGFRSVEEAPDGPGIWPHFFAIGAGVLVHMAIIGTAGFVVASSVLFAACAYGFGSRRPVRDLAIGFVLALVTYLIFARGLSIPLPGGPFSILAA